MDWNLDEALQYYKKQGAPKDQNALIGLLKEIQLEFRGAIPIYILPQIASAYGIGEGFLKAIIYRIPSLRIENTHLLEICNGPNCGKHTQFVQYAETYLKEHPGSFSIKYIPCMRMCRMGPNIKWDGILYHRPDNTFLEKCFSE